MKKQSVLIRRALLFTAIAAVRTIAVKRRARRISTLCFFMR